MYFFLCICTAEYFLLQAVNASLILIGSCPPKYESLQSCRLLAFHMLASIHKVHLLNTILMILQFLEKKPPQVYNLFLCKSVTLTVLTLSHVLRDDVDRFL